ncbi:glycosyltransferase, partial [Salibacteraceae bacterium]|nr:glycosyltransferase [Salibacteraceae bacterium]
MACEVPSVTTSLANNALGAKDEVHLLIGDDTESLAKRINTILSDDALGRKLSIAGKNFVLGNYSWRNEAGRLTQIMELTQN